MRKSCAVGIALLFMAWAISIDAQSGGCNIGAECERTKTNVPYMTSGKCSKEPSDCDQCAQNPACTQASGAASAACGTLVICDCDGSATSVTCSCETLDLVDPVTEEVTYACKTVKTCTQTGRCSNL